ncbi:MAG: flagellar basal body P-ring formation protein FlgA [Methylomonas sp.]|jgi:flagella basal body P-ring formation protein FlgA|uniref:flagellar basal body P-ring formation chaperone FlgA n=1 Tax=Methylomonas sp. TaxID=418 RepID=UPI0025D2D091|nr:flagellar basal body P-ring formation chaperone FlgA [Methylomonas sp.]MCK9608691.1 flagellar basal body P-ring formation protein FlgA [Methylomonas sp.]
MKTITLTFYLLLLASPLTAAATFQSLDAIQEAVQSFVESSLDPAGQYQISSAQIDPRLQLPACSEKLEIFPQSGNIRPGRNTLGIRCVGINNWTIYSTVIVKSFEAVLILTKQLSRNDKISLEHLTTETRETSTLHPGYLRDPNDVINKQATRTIPVGSVLYRFHYREPTLVKRGERVSIQSGKPGLLITSAGVAMADGIKGQQISVKNLSSQRVIQATVIKLGLVSVYF